MRNHEPYIKDSGKENSRVIQERLKDMAGKEKTAGSCTAAARTVQTGKAVKHTGRKRKFQAQQAFCRQPEEQDPQQDQAADIDLLFLLPVSFLTHMPPAFPEKIMIEDYTTRSTVK